MVQKLNRWSHAHESGAQNAVHSTAEISTFTRNTTVHSDRKKNHYNAVSINLSSLQEVSGSYDRFVDTQQQYHKVYTKA